MHCSASWFRTPVACPANSGVILDLMTSIILISNLDPGDSRWFFAWQGNWRRAKAAVSEHLHSMYAGTPLLVTKHTSHKEGVGNAWEGERERERDAEEAP